MEVTFNVEDYLTNDEIRECAKDAIMDQVRKTYSKESDMERLISNLSYQEVFAKIENLMGVVDLNAVIIEKVREVINNLGSYTVFHEADAWGGKQSIASKILEEESSAARPLIKARIEKIIDEYPFNELERDVIGEQVYECVMDRLFGNRS